MGKILGLLVVFLLVVVVGGGVFLATTDIPAPRTKVEKVIADERLPR
jgi:hypothetical protein